MTAGSPLTTTSPVSVPSMPALDRDPENTGSLSIVLRSIVDAFLNSRPQGSKKTQISKLFQGLWLHEMAPAPSSPENLPC